MSRLAEHARFLGTFIRNPRTTGSLIPSSRALARRMLDGLGLETANTVIEIGPGTGAFTGELIRRAKPGARLIAIELEPGFAEVLTRRHPEIEVVNDSAEALPDILSARGIREADAIACSLPWANLPDGVSERIIAALVASLKPGGAFTSYVYLTGVLLPGAWKFRALLRKSFATVERTPVVWANVPPAFVCRCRKAA